MCTFVLGSGEAAEVKERLGVPVEGPHRDDAFLLQRLVESGAEYGIDHARNVVARRFAQ
jgi:hydroxyacylglutathione hydrolase